MSDLSRAIISLMDNDELIEEFKEAIKGAHYSPMGNDNEFPSYELEEEIRRRLEKK